jgi:outer membrane receptor for ferrienterochelin and colicin
MGVQAIQWTQLRANEFGGNGSFSFQDTTSGQPNFPLSGVGYASYLLGAVNTGSLTTHEANSRSQRVWGLYFMDQWRATPRLTVNYGLRWDYTSPWVETYDRPFDPSFSERGSVVQAIGRMPIIVATGYVGQKTPNSLVTCLTDGHPGVSGGGVLNAEGQLVGIPIGRMQGDYRFSFILPLRDEMFRRVKGATATH